MFNIFKRKNQKKFKINFKHTVTFETDYWFQQYSDEYQKELDRKELIRTRKYKLEKICSNHEIK